MNTISRESFEGMNTDSKLNVLFDITFEGSNRIHMIETKLDKRRKFDTAFAGMTGFIGGFLAVIGGKIFK